MGLSWLGIDVGWVYPAADSDGDVYEWTRRRDPGFHLPPAGPVKITRPDGSVVVRQPYTPKDAATALARGGFSVGPIARSIVAKANRTDRGLALENWDSFQRRKPAWIKVWEAIRNQAEARDVPVVQVNRAYTSLTCPKCGHKARANRRTRSTFACVECGFAGHADVVAAMNIAAKAEGRFRVKQEPCGACGGVVWKAGLCARCYRFKRTWGRLPTSADLKARARAKSARDYQIQMRREFLRERIGRTEAELSRRQAEWYATHDAWGNPIDG